LTDNEWKSLVQQHTIAEITQNLETRGTFATGDPVIDAIEEARRRG